MRPVAVMAVALAACRFAADDGATRFRCDGAADCPAGLACSAGFCEQPGAAPADASQPDATDFACPCSLWDDDTIPERLENNDGSAIETAVKLRADVAGRIVGLRFYRAETSPGRHIGRLWSGGGVLLGEVEYGGDSASGWQEAALARPVEIQADTTYLASVYIESGDYVADVAYFEGEGRDRPPLHALADGVDGANGVFVLGAGFPDVSTFMATNYWVDVVFDD